MLPAELGGNKSFLYIGSTFLYKIPIANVKKSIKTIPIYFHKSSAEIIWVKGVDFTFVEEGVNRLV